MTTEGTPTPHTDLPTNTDDATPTPSVDEPAVTPEPIDHIPTPTPIPNDTPQPLPIIEITPDDPPLTQQDPKSALGAHVHTSDATSADADALHDNTPPQGIPVVPVAEMVGAESVVDDEVTSADAPEPHDATDNLTPSDPDRVTPTTVETDADTAGTDENGADATGMETASPDGQAPPCATNDVEAAADSSQDDTTPVDSPDDLSVVDAPADTDPANSQPSDAEALTEVPPAAETVRDEPESPEPVTPKPASSDPADVEFPSDEAPDDVSPVTPAPVAEEPSDTTPPDADQDQPSGAGVSAIEDYVATPAIPEQPEPRTTGSSDLADSEATDEQGDNDGAGDDRSGDSPVGTDDRRYTTLDEALANTQAQASSTWPGHDVDPSTVHPDTTAPSEAGSPATGAYPEEANATPGFNASSSDAPTPHLLGAPAPDASQRDAGHPDAVGSVDPHDVDPGTTPPATDTATQPQPSVGAALWGVVRETVIVVVSALLISLTIKTFLFQMFYIPSKSMESTLVEGDRIVVSQLTPGLFELERGDIIVFEDPGTWMAGHDTTTNPISGFFTSALTYVGILPKNSGQHLVKRLVGMPGDHVACCDDNGDVTINGEPIIETYIKPGSPPSMTPFDTIVPEGRYWVMGDNRSNSQDSRFNRDQPGGGTVGSDDVVGRATMIAWPITHWTWLSNYSNTFDTVPAPSPDN